jgi:hypothetical protein
MLLTKPKTPPEAFPRLFRQSEQEQHKRLYNVGPAKHRKIPNGQRYRLPVEEAITRSPRVHSQIGLPRYRQCSHASTFPNHADVSTEHMSPVAHTKTMHHHRDQRRLQDSAGDNNHMAEWAISADVLRKEERGYPTTGNTFRTIFGKCVAAFGEVGNVFDLEGNFTGNSTST